MLFFKNTEKKRKEKRKEKTRKEPPRSLWKERSIRRILEFGAVKGILSLVLGRWLPVPGGAPNRACLEGGLEAGFAQEAFMPNLLL